MFVGVDAHLRWSMPPRGLAWTARPAAPSRTAPTQRRRLRVL